MKRLSCVCSLVIFLVFFSEIRDSLCKRYRIFDKVNVEENEDAAFKKLQQLEENMIDGMDKMIKQMATTGFDMNMNMNISMKCMSSLFKVISGVTSFKLWAYELLESMGIPFGGTLSGTSSSFGSFDQCLRVKFPQKERSRKKAITGQYCLVSIRPPLPPRPKTIKFNMNIFSHINSTLKTELMTKMKDMLYLSYIGPFRLAICVPSACSKDDVINLAAPLGQKIGLNIDVETCEVKEPFRLDNVQLSLMAVFLLIIGINIIATIVDEISLLLNKENLSAKNLSTTSRITQMFSFRRNFRRLLKIEPYEKRSLGCVDGMKYISTLWVIFIHSYSTMNPALMRQAIDMKDMVADFALQPLMNGSLSVDSFIFLSALLISYNVVKHYDSQRKFNPALILIRRALRLWPSLLVIIGLSIIIPSMGHGPLFKDAFEEFAQDCRTTWWTNILFINNFWSIITRCAGHTWYLAVDSQCLVLGIIYFFLLFKKEKLGNIYLLLMTITSIISTGAVTYIYDFPPGFTAHNIDPRYVTQFLDIVYALPYTHMSIYSIGLYLGTFCARNPKLKMSIWTTVIGWLVTAPSAIALLYGVWEWNKLVPYTVVESVLYASVQRFVWGICLAWVVVACFAGKGGIVNSSLSWPVLQPFVRLSYLLYLTHLPILLFHIYSGLGLTDITHNVLVFKFFGAVMASHIVSAFIRLLCESPVLQLQYLFFQWLGNKKPTKSKNSIPSGGEKPVQVDLANLDKTISENPCI